MNAQESAAIIAVLATAWPGDMTEQQIALWNRDLALVDPDVAHATIEQLRQTEQYRPTLSQFITAKQQVLRRRRNEVPALRAGHRDTSDQARFVRALRATLAAANGGDRAHDHRNGADGCPVCSKHDAAAHVHDRADTYHGPATCPRCKELAHVFLEFLRSEAAYQQGDAA